MREVPPTIAGSLGSKFDAAAVLDGLDPVPEGLVSAPPGLVTLPWQVYLPLMTLFVLSLSKAEQSNSPEDCMLNAPETRLRAGSSTLKYVRCLADTSSDERGRTL